MICPKCGTENKPKFKFCVKCGSNLENPDEVNVEQVDMGGYRSEEDYASEKNNFKISDGTFTINDRTPVMSQGMFTADELNDSEEEFDFSSYDEPYIPKLDADRLSVPNAEQSGFNQNPVQQNPYAHMGQPAAVPQPNMPFQPQNAMPFQPQPAAQFPSQPVPPVQSQMMAPPVQPGNVQNNGYMNPMYGGQPVYQTAQPMMMQPPQITGYDQNGMPVYSQPQPFMYAPPQIIGYDQNGMPVYGQPQPMMYAPPQIIGYDQNGMPVYGQPQPMMYASPAIQPMPQVQQPYQGIPDTAPPVNMGMPMMNGMPAQNMYAQPVPPQPHPQPQPQKNNDTVKVSNEFWDDFFSGGKSDDSDSGDDFFSKPGNSGDMESVSVGNANLSALKKAERKKQNYMSDTPEVNADELAPNTGDKYNKMFMGKTAVVNADDLQAKQNIKTADKMGVTADVNADDLEAAQRIRSRVTMVQADKADPDELQAYEHEHKEAIMEQAEHAVEALPKKKTAPIDELDAIELPEYMQARKTKTDDTPAIPDLSGVSE